MAGTEPKAHRVRLQPSQIDYARFYCDGARDMVEVSDAMETWLNDERIPFSIEAEPGAIWIVLPDAETAMLFALRWS